MYWKLLYSLCNSQELLIFCDLYTSCCVFCLKVCAEVDFFGDLKNKLPLSDSDFEKFFFLTQTQLTVSLLTLRSLYLRDGRLSRAPPSSLVGQCVL